MVGWTTDGRMCNISGAVIRDTAEKVRNVLFCSASSRERLRVDAAQRKRARITLLKHTRYELPEQHEPLVVLVPEEGAPSRGMSSRVLAAEISSRRAEGATATLVFDRALVEAAREAGLLVESLDRRERHVWVADAKGFGSPCASITKRLRMAHMLSHGRARVAWLAHLGDCPPSPPNFPRGGGCRAATMFRRPGDAVVE